MHLPYMSTDAFVTLLYVLYVIISPFSSFLVFILGASHHEYFHLNLFNVRMTIIHFVTLLAKNFRLFRCDKLCQLLFK